MRQGRGGSLRSRRGGDSACVQTLFPLPRQGSWLFCLVCRRRYAPGEGRQLEIPPLGMTALTWGLFMGVSSNLRYQAVFGLERVVDKTIARRVPQASGDVAQTGTQLCGEKSRPLQCLYAISGFIGVQDSHLRHCLLQVAYVTTFLLRFFNNVIGGEHASVWSDVFSAAAAASDASQLSTSDSYVHRAGENFIDTARWTGIQ